MKTNFHTHNYRCGHAVGDVEDYVKEALKHKYEEIGISDHAPIPDYYFDRMSMEEIDDYFDEIEKAKIKYGEQIKIYRSMEIEYFPEFKEYYDKLFKKLDYVLLGLHSYKKDGKIYDSWSVKTDEAAIDYANYMKEAIESGYFDMVAHPDVFMINYRKWTKATEKATHIICQAAEKENVFLEINANGIRKTEERGIITDRYLYPYKEFWEVVSGYNIKVVIGSDCHDYVLIEDEATQIARQFAKDVGIEIYESIFKNDKLDR